MSWHRKRIKLGACTVGALTAALFAVSTTPAAASGTYSGLAYVYGTGAYTNDWGDEGILSRGTHASSNATCLWQKILWADGNLGSLSDVDGVFGTQTYNATRAWQQFETERHGAGLAIDGSVGKETFAWANRNFYQTSGSTGPGQTLWLWYDGYIHDFQLKRDPDGNYQFEDRNFAWRKAGYNYQSCS
ncbi:peptidoglycan-binding protein [Streptomyces phyllanthi]|uniref:Peptidoglycan-binding protein n=1 Tax=Streptomyces phyllanthi TaxID=1803180 RepID=A0A5N8W063_9ACTN|nr:peptidoglycan-binding domain-containing protein [Streptomyces phyllanthi]MPY40887.1 peptidoglycan-binding protein [Streptomyces phyllanthi]